MKRIEAPRRRSEVGRREFLEGMEKTGTRIRREHRSEYSSEYTYYQAPLTSEEMKRRGEVRGVDQKVGTFIL